jgi:hypothetical protein
LQNCSGILLHLADWTAGVDYDEAEAPQKDNDDDDNKDNDISDLDYDTDMDNEDEDEDEDDMEGYNPVDEEELEGLAKDAKKDPSPVDHHEPEAQGTPEEQEES